MENHQKKNTNYFSRRSVWNKMTLKEIYDETKLPRLHFCLTTTELKNAEMDGNNEMDAGKIRKNFQIYTKP